MIKPGKTYSHENTARAGENSGYGKKAIRIPGKSAKTEKLEFHCVLLDGVEILRINNHE
jgi:hypothetical protein